MEPFGAPAWTDTFKEAFDRIPEIPLLLVAVASMQAMTDDGRPTLTMLEPTIFGIWWLFNHAPFIMEHFGRAVVGSSMWVCPRYSDLTHHAPDNHTCPTTSNVYFLLYIFYGRLWVIGWHQLSLRANLTGRASLRQGLSLGTLLLLIKVQRTTGFMAPAKFIDQWCSLFIFCYDWTQWLLFLYVISFYYGLEVIQKMTSITSAMSASTRCIACAGSFSLVVTICLSTVGYHKDEYFFGLAPDFSEFFLWNASTMLVTLVFVFFFCTLPAAIDINFPGPVYLLAYAHPFFSFWAVSGVVVGGKGLSPVSFMASGKVDGIHIFPSVPDVIAWGATAPGCLSGVCALAALFGYIVLFLLVCQFVISAVSKLVGATAHIVQRANAAMGSR
jgi:hypothetical protein